MSAQDDRPLEWRKLWVSIGYLLVLNVLIFALAPVQDAPTLWIPYGDKIAHGLAFMLLMIWFSGLVPRRRYPYLFIALLAYGAVIEGLQYFTGYRAMDPEDLAADAVGLVVGWGLALCGLGGWCHRLELRLRKS
jgi:VanZ family protein